METLACTVFVFAIYCIFACAAYCPKHHQQQTQPEAEPETSINYFPEIEEITEPEPVIVEVPQPAKPKVKATLSSLLREEVAKADNLSSLGVRELYQIASRHGVKGYKSMGKVKLIQTLRGLESATMAS